MTRRWFEPDVGGKVSDMKVFEFLVVAFVVALVGLGIFAAIANRSRFERACDVQHGTTVYDGRQYQCIAKK